MPFLPALRTKALPANYAGPPQGGNTVLSDYYQAVQTQMSSARSRPWPIERAVAEGYERVIWVFKSVEKISGDSARLPFVLHEGDTQIDDHPLLRVLNGQANPLESGRVFRKRLSAQILLSKKGAFVEITKSRQGDILRVDLLPVGRVEMVPGKGDELLSKYRLHHRRGGWRDIPVENVRWFRNPHPTDPFSGTTPLEAMGMSVELDYFARLYNVTFLRNDGRPGGILGVKTASVRSGDGGAAVGHMPAEQMQRIEERFGSGPMEAGKMSVITGELSYVDTATRPRDMAYGELSSSAKLEILAGFGVPETVLGYAADRTYSNAAEEKHTYWTGTMQEHNEVVLDGWNMDSEWTLKGSLDTSTIDVLQLAAIERRKEAREEFTAGLRSLKSYADLAGYGDEIEDNWATRSLYIPQGKTPLPSRTADMESLGMSNPEALPAAPGEPGAGSAALAAVTGEPVEPAPSLARPSLPAGPGTAALEAVAPAAPAAPAATGAPGPGTRALAAAGKPNSVGAGTAAVQALKGRVTLSYESKAKRPTTEVDADDMARLEDQIATVLTSLSVRWVERAVARVESPKARRNTRHWVAQYPVDTRVGTKALDVAKAVDEETWSGEAADAVSPLVTAAAIAAGAAVAAELTGVGPVAASMAASAATANVIAQVTAMVSEAAAGMARRLIGRINGADQEGATLAAIVEAIRDFAPRMASWSHTVGGDAAAASLNGGADATAEGVSAGGTAPLPDGTNRPTSIERTWVSKRDERVRFTHAPLTGADGQRRLLGDPFVVGEALMRFPGDPLAPIGERAGCRCRLRHRSLATGRFVAPPSAA